MLHEIKSAVSFLRTILSRTGSIPRQKVEQFSTCLEQLLRTKFEKHWHPTKPFRGSAYRCIRINHTYVDPVVVKAAGMSGVDNGVLKDILPKEFTLWIDPNDVSYRIGEDGSICELLATSDKENDNGTLENTSDPDTTPTLTPNQLSHLQLCHQEVSKIATILHSSSSSLTECMS